MESIQREARCRALISLGLTELVAERQVIETQQEELDQRDHDLLKEMFCRIATPEQQRHFYPGHEAKCTVERAIERRQAVHQEEVLAETEVGRKILALELEKENLLDTIWLATSPAQLKTLWSHVTALLGDEQTPLERDALAIEPMEA